MTAKMKLSALHNRAPLLLQEASVEWPIPDQFVGVEIEMENVPRGQLDKHRRVGSPFWDVKEDGSLRNGRELVLSQAMVGSQLSAALNYFFDNFSKYTISPRTSIHVHLNMRQETDTVESLRNMVMLYYMYEDAYFSIADESRKWCSYCMPLDSNVSPFLAELAKTEPVLPVLEDRLVRMNRNNTDRYYGLNLAALQRYGTLEFRHFPLVDDRRRLFDWIRLLMELKSAATTVSVEGPMEHIIRRPEDLRRLESLMPLFGSEVLGRVADQVAMLRMHKFLALGRAPIRLDGMVEVDNKVVSRFLQALEASGKKITGKAKAAKGSPKTMKINAGQQRMPHAQFDVDTGTTAADTLTWNAGRLMIDEARDVTLNRAPPAAGRDGGFIMYTAPDGTDVRLSAHIDAVVDLAVLEVLLNVYQRIARQAAIHERTLEQEISANVFELSNLLMLARASLSLDYQNIINARFGAASVNSLRDALIRVLALGNIAISTGFRGLRRV